MKHRAHPFRAARRRIIAALMGLLATGPVSTVGQEPGRAGLATTAARALEPIAPVLPAAVVAALQEGRFAEAIAGLERFGTTPDERSYAALIGGAARRLDGRLDAARTVLEAALAADPGGPWAGKLRAELAAVELAAGRFNEAEALARVEAEALLAAGRKDRLAGIYQAFAERLLNPVEPVVPPDPEAAHALLEQGRNVAKGLALRARLLLELARASQAAGNHGRAIAEFQAYLNEYAQADLEPADLDAARFGLGESQLAANQHLAARLTWDELIRAPRARDRGDTHARAMYQLARTYQIPKPSDDTQLYLGVAALRRFLEAYPAHPLAVRAAYEIAASYLARGRAQDALAALNTFIKGEGFRADSDEAQREQAAKRMQAVFEVGQVLQHQGNYDEAIAAFQGYLGQFPNGPQSAAAQRAILDTRLAQALDHQRNGRHDRARQVWRDFAAANPLDGRVPQVLFQVGASFLKELPRKPDEAIAAWELVAAKFPTTEPAGHAQFEIAALFETEKGDPAGAIERFRKITVEPWKSRALQRIAVMERRELVVVTPRTFRTGETPHLRITTRNLEQLTFTAYKLDPEAYFRKKHVLAGVESLDIGLVAPDAEWTAEVKGYAQYKPIETTYKLDAKVAVPGVWVVKVSDEKHLQATTLVLGSDLDAIVKASRDQVLVFVQDIQTGQGRPNVRVLVAQGEEVLLEAATGADGVLLKNWDRPRDPNAALQYLVLDGQHAAGSGLTVPEAVAQGLSARAYLYTDRPAYRPGQTVALRGIVREVAGGQYAVQEGAGYRLEVIDSRGRPFLSQPVSLSRFGTVHTQFALDPAAPVGTYQVRLYQPGKSEFAGQFEVQQYQLQKVDLTFDLPRTVFYRGERVEGAVVATYQYGTPLANRPIQVLLPDGRTVAGATDAAGRYAFSFATEGYGEAQVLAIQAALPEDNVAAAARVAIAVLGFGIRLETVRTVYLDGESFPLEITTRDALGEPIGQELTVSILKRVTHEGTNVSTEREVSKAVVRTDAKTGQVRLMLKVEDRDGGPHVVRVAGTDRFGNPVVADRPLTISGASDEQKLRLLADRQRFKVGERAAARLINRGPKGTGLLTWEADRVLSYRIVLLNEGENALTWEVSGEQFPNFTLAAAAMAGSKFHEARLDVGVERELNLAVKPVKESYGPGESVEVEVTTTDQLGRPVAAEVALALVDFALLRLFRDPLPPLGAFFHDQKRVGAFTTEATNTFTYRPETVPVPEAVVEESERLAAAAADDAARRGLAERAGSQVATAPPAPPPAPASAAGYAMMPGLQDHAAIVESRPALGTFQAGQGLEQLNAQMGELKLRDGSVTFFGKELRGGGEAVAADAFGREADERQMGERMARRAGRAGVPAAPRQAFIETAYWNPSVVTGPDGKAKVVFPAPMALSRYQLAARGTTGADTLVGQTTAELSVKKNFLVDLKRPAVLTQGDKPRFHARVHHVGLKGQAAVALKVYAGEREQTYPKTIAIEQDGVSEVLFEPFEVPEGDVVRLTLSARLGEASDELVQEVPIRPWGVQAYASASGSASNDATAIVSLPAGRAYENPEMLIVLSPTVRRMLVELALGREAVPLPRQARIRFPVPPETVADRAGDLLAAASVLGYLRSTRAVQAPEATRLTDQVRAIAGELLTLQNEDGGWPWVAAGSGQQRPSDRLASARAFWALAELEPLGLLANPAALDKAGAFLAQQFAAAGEAESDVRSALLHALSTRKKAAFEQANALNRIRQGLSDAALGYLALTFANLDRASLAGEVLGVLGPRARTESAGPGLPVRVYWTGASRHPGLRGPVEATALAALAYARSQPQAPQLGGAVAWLLAHRVGTGWLPHTAKGPALAALGLFHARGESAEDRYRLVVSVNDQEVHRVDVVGSTAGEVIAVPRRVLRPGGENRVRFDLDGRGTFGYAVTLTGFTREFGPDQDRANRTAILQRRITTPADPELDGKPLPAGFGVAVGATTFENLASQLPLGGRARIKIDASRVVRPGQPAWEQDFLIVEEHLPAGATVVEGSIQSNASYHTVGDGVLTFYYAPEVHPGRIQYDVFGYLPGQYRALPAEIRSAYEPGRRHLGPVGDLTVLAPGEPSTDPYKPTPDELYARGKALFDADRLAEAAGPLEGLWNNYTLRDDVARDAARMLLFIHLKSYDPRKIVTYFEYVRDKSPDLVIPFDQVLIVGRAYRDLGEYERAFLVWRGVAEASYLEDARLGELLRQRGRALEGIALLLELWRGYPNTAAIESDFFGLAQLLASLAGKATTDPALRKELGEAGKTRSDLLLQSIRLTQVFLSQSPRNPLAEEASLALLGAFLELENHQAVVELAERYAKLYPRSTFLDSFQYSGALGLFHLGRYNQAIELAEKIAAAVYKDANGVDQPSPNKWQALYIIGQIHDARRDYAKAVRYYEQVADRFTDAAEAVKTFTRKGLKLPEVTVLRPPATPKVAAGGLHALPAAPEAKRVELDYRNIAEVDVKVYPVDLMRLYLTRRSLEGIASIDLAGITPLLQKTISLGDGKDFDDKVQALDLPLTQEGAYLVMARGENLYASGIALVSPLELEVIEEPGNSRVRVLVRDAATKAPVPRVLVKVIGTGNAAFFSGETDLRGVFVAEGVSGQVTAVARQDASKGAPRYAFHRGTIAVGAPPAPTPMPSEAKSIRDAEQTPQSLEENLKRQNTSNQMRQIERLEQRYQAAPAGGAAAGGFK